MKSFKHLRFNRLQQCCRISSTNFSNYAKLSSNLNSNQSTTFPRVSQGNAVLCRHFSKFPPHSVIKLPNLSPTMETGNIVSWAKAEGDEISEGDLLAEIETDKATMALDASDEGFLAKILLQKGAEGVPVGTPLCITVEDQASIAKFADFTASDVEGGTAQPAAPVPPPPAAAPTSVAPSTPKPSMAMGSDGQRIFVTPLAKKMAEQQGIILTPGTQGSGYMGSITAGDLPRISAMAPSQQPMSSSSTAPFTDIKMSNMRSTIAKRLLESKQTIPHYYLTVDINMDEIITLRESINQKLSKAGDSADVKKISVNDMVVKAASMACMKVPDCNSSFQGSFIRQYNQVDMCVAVATENGLITPIIPSSESKSFTEISAMTKELAGKAKTGKLQPHEFQGGTFTISNLGMFGIDHFSAIINPPQACILAVGGTEKRLIPDKKSEKGFKESSFMTVTLCCDHRVVDGAVGATWLKKFREMMEEPAMMLL